MSRLICIQASNYSRSIPNFINISLDRLDTIINYSVDHICFYDLELLDTDTAEQVLDQLIEKIRPSGIITIGVTNTKKICRDYYMNSIDDITYIKYHSGHRSVFSDNKLIGLLEKDKNIKTIKLEYTPDQLEILITAQRVSI